jgi:N-methylhydantoinase A
MTAPHILGVDIGGTFTDFVLLRDGTLTIHKLPSTPTHLSQALLQGVALLGPPETLIHGTTAATNALLERRGATTALLTTAGFADVLVIGRGTRPRLYDLDMELAPPVVPADLRLEVPERIAADGSILQPLDEATVQQHIEHLIAAGVESVAVCLLHSYTNPTHEERVAALLRAVPAPAAPDAPRFFVCHSADIIPEHREYERTSTTVVNAYVAPVLDRYLGEIEQALAAYQQTHGIAPRLHIMASDGGSMTAGMARRLAARTTLSGPAGGVVGARAVAQQAGFERIITFDMGGTSTDVALCDGHIPQTTESSVGGLAVRFPSTAIHTVGAGGGSLARMDAGGALRVGPQSAGAHPGPACYGRGTLPTVTDANLVLGRLRAAHFLGGAMHLDVARAEAALRELAHTLALDVQHTALGIVRVANAAMERAIRTISVERGIDPRDFTLVAFGGAGPLHAVYLADMLGMQRVLLPRYPGVLSALGMLTAETTRDYVQVLMQPLARLTPALLLEQMRHLAEQGAAEVAHASSSTAPLHFAFTLDLRYVGQAHEIATPLTEWQGMQPQPPDLQQAAQHFHTLHRQYSGHAMPDQPIEVVALRLKCIAPRQQDGASGAAILPPADAPATSPRQRASAHEMVQAALSAETTAPHETALYQREALQPGDTIAAPAIIVQFDTTCVIPPGWHAHVDSHAHVVVQKL